ncbi:TIGR03086 family metal-binding protein [Kitasatospora sp. NBC_01302]|uniref:TIGR03086 family metal-binding protein n=1 Tax=Kitasatospora sp. NBC_01302 TaxID=2903575 RepID=UPI002E13789F|nr:TIGR03086 family metal-binding protein [Kitasatospora sp. NBC_01302]
MSQEGADRRRREVLRLYAEALASVGRRVQGVAANQWQTASPCSARSVRELVNHLTAEQLWVPELLRGATPCQVGGRFAGDVLGADPAASWSAAATAAREAFGAPGALELAVRLSTGERPALEFCAQLTVDLTVHTWDLARATGQDPHLAPELVEFALHELAPRPGPAVAVGCFAPAVPTVPHADPQTRMLGLVGRRCAPQPPFDPELTD